MDTLRVEAPKNTLIQQDVLISFWPRIRKSLTPFIAIKERDSLNPVLIIFGQEGSEHIRLYLDRTDEHAQPSGEQIVLTSICLAVAIQAHHESEPTVGKSEAKGFGKRIPSGETIAFVCHNSGWDEAVVYSFIHHLNLMKYTEITRQAGASAKSMLRLYS